MADDDTQDVPECGAPTSGDGKCSREVDTDGERCWQHQGEPGRPQESRQTCPEGHPWTPSNTRHAAGGRVCRICSRS